MDTNTIDDAGKMAMQSTDTERVKESMKNLSVRTDTASYNSVYYISSGESDDDCGDNETEMDTDEELPSIVTLFAKKQIKENQKMEKNPTTTARLKT